jgi:hypothetical protein
LIVVSAAAPASRPSPNDADLHPQTIVANSLRTPPALQIPHAVQPVIRNHGTLLVDRFGAPLPSCRCFLCNAPAEHQVRKTFRSTGGRARYLILLQPLLIPLLLPLHLLRRNGVSVTFGLCRDCRERQLLGIALGICFLFGSVPLLVHGALTIASLGLIPALGGACLAAAGILTIGRSRHLADPKHLDARWLVLRGGGPRFLEAIPEAPRWES